MALNWKVGRGALRDSVLGSWGGAACNLLVVNYVVTMGLMVARGRG